MGQFKEALRKYMETNNISQIELAEIMGVSQQSISGFLSKDGSPQPSTRRKYFDKLQGFKDFHNKYVHLVDVPQTGLLSDFNSNENYNVRINMSSIGKRGIDREPDAHWYGVPNTMMVPMISHRAQAGFLSGWADDTATLEDFPKIPWEVDREYKGKYVCFEVTGDSMDDGSRESLIDGDVILCREVMQQHWRNRLHINQWDFVIAHKEKGIVVKRIVEHEVETGRLVLHSLNEMYDDYEVYMQDCIAIFNVVDVKRSRRR